MNKHMKINKQNYEELDQKYKQLENEYKCLKNNVGKQFEEIKEKYLNETQRLNNMIEMKKIQIEKGGFVMPTTEKQYRQKSLASLSRLLNKSMDVQKLSDRINRITCKQIDTVNHVTQQPLPQQQTKKSSIQFAHKSISNFMPCQNTLTLSQTTHLTPIYNEASQKRSTKILSHIRTQLKFYNSKPKLL